MRNFTIILLLVAGTELALAWVWGLDHRMDYLSRDYALFIGKEKMLEHYSEPGLIIFGDSGVMDAMVPEQLGPHVINGAMSGCTPIESYFLLQRLLKGTVKPKAVLLSYNTYHFVHPDFYWENTLKFGLLRGSEADDVMEQAIRLQDKEILTGSGIANIEDRIHSFLLSRGFPAYYVSSLIAQPWGVREKENDEALEKVTQTRGQYYFPLMDGSKALNADTKIKEFVPSPVVDLYFKKTLELLKSQGIPVYFYTIPINEASVPYLDVSVFKAFQSYLGELAKNDPQFHILPKPRTVYSWKLFSDYAHLNEKGTARFDPELTHILNEAHVPGGPFGITPR